MFIRQTDYQVSQCVYGKAGRMVGQRGWPEVGRCPLFSIFFLPSLPLIFSSLTLSFLPLCRPFIPSCPLWWTSLGPFAFFISSSTLFLASISSFIVIHPPTIIIIIIIILFIIIFILISEDILVER